MNAPFHGQDRGTVGADPCLTRRLSACHFAECNTRNRTILSLSDFPPIERFSPYCLLGCIEAVCRFRFGIRSTCDCHYDHSFVYRRDGGCIRRKDGGLFLDLTFSGGGSRREAVLAELRARHGVSVVERRVPTLSEFDAYCEAALRDGKPFVAPFDLFYLAGRREYRNIHQSHYVCVIGRDDRSGDLEVVEQMLGRCRVGRQDFAEMVAGAPDAGYAVLDCARELSNVNFDSLGRLKRDLARFRANLLHPEPAFGLGALSAFRADLVRFVESEGASPHIFYVPGMWSFSHERDNFRRVLATATEVWGGSGANHGVLGDLLATLHERWFELDHRTEAAIRMQRPSLQAAAFASLGEIAKLECRMPDLLGELEARL